MKFATRFGTVCRTGLFLLGLFFAYLMLQLTLPYFSFRYDVGFLLTKQAVLHKVWWRTAFYVHILSSLLVLVAGLFQFSRKVLQKYPLIHRVLGRIYVFGILGLSAPSGLIMAVYASGGFWAKLSFSLIAVLWFCFTWVALQKVLQKDFQGHTAFMYRSFALTLSAIALRSYAWILPFFSEIHHLHGREMYVWISWLSWVPNLIIAEILIARKFRSRKTVGFKAKNQAGLLQA